MSRSNSTFRRFYTGHLPDGSIVESPTPLNNTPSSESRQEFLRTPVQAYQSRLDAHMEPEPPSVPPLAPTRPRRTSQSVPFNPSNHPVPSVEEHREEGQEPRVEQYRTNRQHTRPPASYTNFPEQSARYGPMPRNTWDANTYPAYADTPGRPNYEMYYPYYQDAYAQYAATQGSGGGRGPPPPMPSAEQAMRLPWMIWMGSNAKNRKSTILFAQEPWNVPPLTLSNRLCSIRRRICRYLDVFVFRLFRHPSRQH
jgi:aquaporin related protein